jgi:hypothetical protein
MARENGKNLENFLAEFVKGAERVLIGIPSENGQYPSKPTQSGTVPLFVQQFHIF